MNHQPHVPPIIDCWNDYGKGRIVIVEGKKAKVLKEIFWNLVVIFQQDGQYKGGPIRLINNKIEAESLHTRKQGQKNSN